MRSRLEAVEAVGVEEAEEGPESGWVTVLSSGSSHHTVDHRNTASPYVHIDVLYYQNPKTFGI